MALSKLSAECDSCLYKNTCQNKRMEMVGYLQPIQNESQETAQESLTVPHTEVTIDLEDFKKEIEKSIAKSGGLYGGFFNNCS